MSSKVIFIIGPSGCGKTRVGMELANFLHVSFIDADDYHSKSNIEKMSRGESLNDDDRYPWLISVRKAIVDQLNINEKHVVVACSALKESYRQILSLNNSNSIKEYFFYLQADSDLLHDRLSNRKGHFMPASLIQSQLNTFELPPEDRNNFYTLSANKTVSSLISSIISFLE